MRGLPNTLRGRLLLSHLVVVAIGALVVLVAGRRLGSVFVHDHLRSMSSMMGGMASGDAATLEDGIGAAFNRALTIAALVSALVALIAALFAAGRVVRPLQEVRRVARRLATGSYGERVAVPAEEELAAVADDINALAGALEETELRRAQLIGEVAHELRTPVATLKGYMEGLLDGVFEPDPETLVAAVREAERMERLAADLSVLSRAEEKRIELHLEAVDLGALVAQVADRLHPQFDDKGVVLALDAVPDVIAALDRDRISQILTNLIGNALTYTPAGGQVTVRSVRQSDVVRVTVTDDGRGLSPDQLEMVFERFFRADRSIPGGTGIGLTIARSLARSHGGDVMAASPGIDEGATFTLTLPINKTGAGIGQR